MKQKGYNIFQVIVIIIITSIISGLTIGVIITKNDFGTSNINYYDVAGDNDLQRFIESYSKLSEEYYIDINKTELIENAINSMTSFLDEKYTSLLDEKKANDLFGNLNSTYNGIGVVLKNNEVIYIVKDSPAEKNNIKINDRIISINDNIIEKEKNISEYLKDNNIVKVQRNGEIVEINVQTSNIKNPSSFSYNINDITYLNINSFSYNTFEEMKVCLEKDNNNKIVVDLRNNPGGYLSQAKLISSYFSNKGDVIYYIKGQKRDQAIKDDDNYSINKDIVVLVNNNTASAAEILAMSLKTNNSAIVVGENTYGKGKIQQAYNLNDGSVLKYTTAYWLTPEKKCIDAIGIVPDYIISNDENDLQLNKAIELLSK